MRASKRVSERARLESGGCGRTACYASNNKPWGVINAGYNIMEAQKCISQRVLPLPCAQFPLLPIG